ncbi:MAG: acyl-CoA synthetase (AMP-forming)/AMP-acid ligase [Deltaproteobacteria bacterium]|nr:acyl-CoA synthetase (AMP-forming)/AMP-acid ligase [Deltaproteobacteria bacterium]
MRPIRYTDEMIEEFKRDGYWTDEVFSDFWKRNSREYGDREALVDSRYRVTWSEAWKLLNNLAWAWVNMGIPRDSRIIIQAPNSVYGFIARIAAERAGLISLTVYPYLREKELTYMVERTEAVAVAVPHIYRKFNYLEMYTELKKVSPFLKYFFLFEEEVPSGAPENTYSLIQLANKDVAKEKYVELDSRRFSAYKDVGLLTSTTGTTGLPKLVEWPVASRVCTSKARISIWKLTKDDITVAVAPHAGGAAGTLTYFAAPLAGAKTVMMEEFDPEGALALIEKEKATAIGVVPTHLVRMLEKDETKYNLSSLRFIRSAGGYLPPQVAEEAERRFKATITSDLGTQDVGSVSGCTIDDPGEIRRRTVGRMLPGNKVRLLDDNGKEVGPGEPGQLWFRGPHAPAGYYRDPEMTTPVFDKDGWTTTGDIVKSEDGFLWIMGRSKDMIIRGGQNIYPAEIEGILNEHPTVANVAIVGYPDREMGERACAYVVLKQGQSLTKEEMVEFLKSKKLALYKLPERIEIVGSLPIVGDSGKVDKKVLKAELEKKVAG